MTEQEHCETCKNETVACCCPTVLTVEDIDKFVEKLMNGDFDPKYRPCLLCSKEFLPNYSAHECDECYFSRWPKEEREAFYRSFFE